MRLATLHWHASIPAPSYTSLDAQRIPSVFLNQYFGTSVFQTNLSPLPYHLSHLCRWRSFQRGGSVAVYVAVYALGFLASSLFTLTGGIPVFIYLCYMTIFISGLYFAMGTVGFLASYIFVHAIFKAVKSE